MSSAAPQGHLPSLIEHDDAVGERIDQGELMSMSITVRPWSRICRMMSVSSSSRSDSCSPTPVEQWSFGSDASARAISCVVYSHESV